MLSGAFAKTKWTSTFSGATGAGIALMKKFCEELTNEYSGINLKSYEIWYNSTNYDFYTQKASEMGIPSEIVRDRMVPITIIGSKYWKGYREDYNSTIIEQVEKCVNETVCFSSPDSTESEDFILNIPVIGKIDLSQVSLYLVQ